MIEIGIKDIGVYLGDNQISNFKQKDKFKVDENFINNKVGFQSLAKKDESLETSDLCVRAINDLVQKTGLALDNVECLVVVTQNPDAYGLPHVSAIAHGKLGLTKHCAAFDISLGCSGYVYALSIVSAFMQANHLTCGVLVTADPYSKIIDISDKNTALLFGDAATATLLTQNPTWKLGKFDFGTAGKFNNILSVNAERKLKMNGRGVFNCSVKEVPQSIAQTLAKNQLQENQIDKFILHQGSKYIVDTLLEKLAYNADGFYAKEYGNTVSSSIPIVINQCLDGSESTLLLAGFGVGFSWASTVLTKEN